MTKAPVQAALGIDATDINKPVLTKSGEDFDTLLGKFLGDLASGHVNRRAKGAETFKAYGRELGKIAVSGKGQFVSGLLTMIPLNLHAPLVSIGAWVLLESLSALAGRGVGTDFPSFFSVNRRSNCRLPTGKGAKAVTKALEQVATSGGVTKHAGTAVRFNGNQLANDMATLKELILKRLEDTASAKPKIVVAERPSRRCMGKTRSNSPLRYPGGKTCRYEPAAHILRLNKLERCSYAEHYAGGSGLAMVNQSQQNVLMLLRLA